MIIVTGGAGFIGSALVAKLNAEGERDILIVDNLGTSDKWKNLIGKSFRKYIPKAQFREMLRNDSIAGSIDAIVHLGACSSTLERNVDYLMDNNVEYSREIAEYALQRAIRFIYASSAATYGDGANGYSDDHKDLAKLKPLNPYGFSKHLFDLWLDRQKVLAAAVGLKFFNVYGPNEYHKTGQLSVAYKLFNEISQTGKASLFKSYRPNYKDGEQSRDFIYVKDCTDVMWWFLNNPKANGIFNLGSGTSRTWNDLARSVFSALKKPEAIDYIPMPDSLINQYQYHTEASIKKLAKAGYKEEMSSLEVGIGEYVEKFLAKDWQYL